MGEIQSMTFDDLEKIDRLTSYYRQIVDLETDFKTFHKEERKLTLPSEFARTKGIAGFVIDLLREDELTNWDKVYNAGTTHIKFDNISHILVVKQSLKKMIDDLKSKECYLSVEEALKFHFPEYHVESFLYIIYTMCHKGFIGAGLYGVEVTRVKKFLASNPELKRTCKKCGRLLHGYKKHAEFCGDKCRITFTRKKNKSLTT